MITREKKIATIKNLKDKLEKARVLVFFDFSKLKAPAQRKLKKDIYFTIAKKTLVQRALKELDVPLDINALRGPTAVAFGTDESIFGTIARAGKEYGLLKILGGFINKGFIDQNSALELASLPSRKELYGKLVWILHSFAGGFVTVLSEVQKKFLTTLSNIKK